jgi:hypothetical protein
MKLLKPFSILLTTATIATSINAQKIKVVEGNLDFLKNETSILTEFTYDNLKVGKFDNEADYINKKKEEAEKKEAGKGAKWESNWKADRKDHYEPKFNELFTKEGGFNIDLKAKYTLILHTTFIEPGYNIGITRKNAYIDAEAIIVETANKNKVLARITIDNSPGSSFGGMDFDSGARIGEAYAKAGKSLGKKIK